MVFAGGSGGDDDRLVDWLMWLVEFGWVNGMS